jgi:hypothetical protein
MSTEKNDKFGIVILLDSLGTRDRLKDDIDAFMNDWDSVLTTLEANVL